MARLLDVLSAGALQAGDKWYDVKTLVAAAKNEEPTKKKPRQEKGNEGADLNTDATKKRPNTSKRTASETQAESNSEGSDDPGSEGSSGDWDSWASTA